VIKDAAVQERLNLNLDTVAKHRNILKAHPDFAERVVRAAAVIDSERRALLGQGEKPGDPQQVDGQLYDGFLPKSDQAGMRTVRMAAPQECAKLNMEFQDRRLQAMFPIYKARNHSQCLSDDERQTWDEFCRKKLLGGGQSSALAKYFGRLQELSNDASLGEDKRFLLEELQLYGESIMPVPDEA
jgi:exodeoxyribonuclease-1